MLQAAELIAVEVAARADRSGSSAELSAHESAQEPLATGIIDHLLLPVPLSLHDAVEAHLRARPPGSLRAQVLHDSERHRAYAHSRLAIACCGTVNVELARARVPQVSLVNCL
jgi:lipid A disaccharide synthetase